MKHYFTPLFMLVCALFFFSGCVNTGALVVTGLRVELTSIQRKSDGTASVTWRMINPNVTPYLVAEMNSKIYLNGTLVGTVHNREAIGLPQQESATRTTALTLAGPAADRLLAEAAQQGSVSYRADSALVIQIYGDENEKGSISHSGTVTVVSK